MEVEIRAVKNTLNHDNKDNCANLKEVELKLELLIGDAKLVQKDANRGSTLAEWTSGALQRGRIFAALAVLAVLAMLAVLAVLACWLTGWLAGWLAGSLGCVLAWSFAWQLQYNSGLCLQCLKEKTVPPQCLVERLTPRPRSEPLVVDRGQNAC